MSLTSQSSGGRSITVAAVQSQLQFYGRQAEFADQMARDVERAMEHTPDLIVFPEDIGIGLAALDAPRACVASSLHTAMFFVGLHHARRALPWILNASVSLPRALLLAVAERMREVYVTTFSDIASAYGVFIAAGSTVLPHEGDTSGAVYNTFHFFGRDGALLHTADKVNLIDLEARGGLDLAPGSPEQVRVWHTPIGSFAPLICLDAWDVELAARLVAEGAQMLLVPSADLAPWNEEERREGMYSRIRELGVPGVEAFGVGRLAGLVFEGRSWILTPDASRPDGVRILAQAASAREPGIVAATVQLSARAAGDRPRPSG